MIDGPDDSTPPFRDRGHFTQSSHFLLIPRGGVFEGQVVISGETRIEGSVRGTLRGEGELVLGGDARIEGVIECDVLSCHGEIVGPVTARVRAHFGVGTRLDGDLEAPAVEIDDGVIWNGRARVFGPR